MKKKLIEVSKERREYLKDWLAKIKKANERIPDIQDMVEQTEWDVDMFSNMPDGGEEFISPRLLIDYSKGNEFLKSNLPLPPHYTIQTVNITSSVITSGSTGAYTTILLGSEVNDPFINQWSKEYSISYRKIQEKQSRFEKVNQYLKKINADRIDELETSRNVYLATIAGVGKKIAAGIAMRNLLEHFKGDLFEKARLWPKENMTWKLMAGRLTVNGDESFDYEALIRQKSVWTSLHNVLSDVAKNKKQGKDIDLESVWVKLIDHLFIVLGIINLIE